MSHGSPLGVGAPMWANRAWVGVHLPRDTPSGTELAAYARVCNAVEGNTTFYALPSPATVLRWRAQAPEGFRFLLKLPRTITHDRRLRHADAEVREFADRLAPLADRMGPVAVQLPASFAPDDLGALTAFLDALPGDHDWAVEVRHPGFHAGGDHERALNDALHARGVDRIVLDSRALFSGPRATPEEQEAWARKPRLPVRAVATAGQPVVRFIGRTDPGANQAFWAPWVARVARWIADGRRPLVFLHTPDNMASPALCRAFHAEVTAVAGTEPLPPPPPVAAARSLFDTAD